MKLERSDEDNINETPFGNIYQLWSLCGTWAFVPFIFLGGVAMRDWRGVIFALSLASFLLVTERTRFMLRDAEWFKRLVILSCSGQFALAVATFFAPLKFTLIAGLAFFCAVVFASLPQIFKYAQGNNIP